MKKRLTERIKKILEAVIIEYVCTGAPVSSGMLSKEYIPGFSSATIRNIMSEMEELGYLAQPHASAGRVPTDKGFRLYVDSILKVKELSGDEREKINTSCRGASDIGDVLHTASNILSSFSNCMGIVLPPKFDSVYIRHIEFIRLNRSQIIALIVSSAGIVQNRILHVDEDLRQHDLDRISAYLNEISAGLTIKELKLAIIEKMKEERVFYDKLLDRALRFGKLALDRNQNDDNVYVEGKVNIIDHPEFRDDMERMKRLFRAFEEKAILVKLLDKAMLAKGIQVFIGSENGFREIDGCSVITAPYGSKAGILGTLGVIGPKRMDYSRVIPLVNYTANLLSNIVASDESCL